MAGSGFSNHQAASIGPRIREIEPICARTDRDLSFPGAPERFLELPIRAAVLHLNTLSIRTISASANCLDEGKNGHVSLSYEELSPENRAVADELVAEGHGYRSNRLGPTVLVIELPIAQEERAESVHRRAMTLASRFAAQ